MKGISILKISCLALSLAWAVSLYASEALTAKHRELAKKIGFDEEVLVILQQSGHGFEPLVGVNQTGNRVEINGLSFTANEQQSQALVKSLDTKLATQGYHIFVQELGYGYISDRIGVIKSRDKYDILRTRRTHAYSHDLDTEQIISTLKVWDKHYGLRLVGAGYNWVKAELQHLPKNMPAFSREVLAFCPDVLIHKSGTLAQLEQDIKSDHMLFLQWK